MLIESGVCVGQPFEEIVVQFVRLINRGVEFRNSFLVEVEIFLFYFDVVQPLFGFSIE